MKGWTELVDKLEKVINDLTAFRYWLIYGKLFKLNVKTIDKAIRLLKEQKELLEKKQHDIDKMCLENSRLKHLINDKQPRAVKNVHDFGEVVLGDCPSCGDRVVKASCQNFCGKCGDRIDWKDGEQE